MPLQTKRAALFGLLLITLSLLSLLFAACGDTATPGVSNSVATSALSTNSALSNSTATSAPSTTSAPSNSTATSAPFAGKATGNLTVFAAASLTDPFNEIKANLEKLNPGFKVSISFGGSNTLRTQLEQGAKADVFASANQTEMDKALASNLVADKGTTFVRNRLVVILPKANPGKIQSLQDLAKSGIKFVTAQKDVPVGGYTLTALDKMSKDPSFGSDFSTKVQANIVSKETDVKQVVAKVQTGEADAGIVYSSDVSTKVSADITSIDIPDQFNTLATYPIAILKGATNPDGARVFLNYVLGVDGQSILKKNNFIPAKDTTSSLNRTAY